MDVQRGLPRRLETDGADPIGGAGEIHWAISVSANE